MKIRRAIASDAGAIARVHVNAWRSAYPGTGIWCCADLSSVQIVSRISERIGGRLLKEKKPITIGGQEYTCIGYGYDVPGLVTALLAGRNQKSNSNRSAAN